MMNWDLVFMLVGIFCLISGPGRVRLLSGLSLFIIGIAHFVNVAPLGNLNFVWGIALFSLPLVLVSSSKIRNKDDITILLGMLGFSLWEISYASGWVLSLPPAQYDEPASLVLFLIILLGSIGGKNGRFCRFLSNISGNLFSRINRNSSYRENGQKYT